MIFNFRFGFRFYFRNIRLLVLSAEICDSKYFTCDIWRATRGSFKMWPIELNQHGFKGMDRRLTFNTSWGKFVIWAWVSNYVLSKAMGNTHLFLSIDLRCHRRPRMYVAQPIGKISNAWFKNVIKYIRTHPLTQTVATFCHRYVNLETW